MRIDKASKLIYLFMYFYLRNASFNQAREESIYKLTNYFYFLKKKTHTHTRENKNSYNTNSHHEFFSKAMVTFKGSGANYATHSILF